jgi:DNA-binding transcriptional MerR regulator
MDIHEFSRQAGVSVRTLRNWSSRGLLPRVRFRGVATDYPPSHLVYAKAVRVLLKRRLGVEAIRRLLAGKSADDVALLAGPGEQVRSAPVSITVAPANEPAPAKPSPTRERWQRVTLLPGLELHVRDDAGPVIARVADEIAERYRSPLA